MIEDPLYFGDKIYPLNFHKKKLVYLKSAMTNYFDTLRENGYDVKYICCKELHKDEGVVINYLTKNSFDSLHFIDPVDYLAEKRLRKNAAEAGIKLVKHQSPGFINEQEQLESYFAGKKRFFMNKFYIDQRTRHKILIDNGLPLGGKWNFDTENRKRLPKNFPVPELNWPSSEKNLSKAKKYVAEIFPDAVGSSEGPYPPVDARESRKWLNDFFSERFLNYGEYQDSISRNSNYLFHSVISPMLNIGLLTPAEVIWEALEFAGENNVPMNSLEGFIRQILGWREFIRAVYVLKGVEQRNSNFWNCSGKMPAAFYNASTGIEPVDNTIRRLLDTAYNHHIERLMVLGNFMLLCEIEPTGVYNWFMEMYIDSYDWVMVPNVYGMSQFADGGLMSTKPYISSSNYISKMSDYPAGNWKKIWDALFWRFVFKHKDYFSGNMRTVFMARQLEKMGPDKIKGYIKHAEEYLNTIM